MALRKTVQTKQGVQANYHKIILDNTDTELVSYYVLLFLNETARTNECEPFPEYRHHTFDVVGKKDLTENQLLTLAYVNLKSKPDFIGAEDC